MPDVIFIFQAKLKSNKPIAAIPSIAAIIFYATEPEKYAFNPIFHQKNQKLVVFSKN
jgi:hypothetical protein